VEHTIHDRTAGRHEAAADAGHDPAAPRDLPNEGTRPATHYTGADEPVLICSWCPALHILRMQRREQDVIVIYQQGKELRVMRNGVEQRISHGICVPCRERLKR